MPHTIKLEVRPKAHSDISIELSKPPAHDGHTIDTRRDETTSKMSEKITEILHFLLIFIFSYKICLEITTYKNIHLDALSQRHDAHCHAHTESTSANHFYLNKHRCTARYDTLHRQTDNTTDDLLPSHCARCRLYRYHILDSVVEWPSILHVVPRFLVKLVAPPLPLRPELRHARQSVQSRQQQQCKPGHQRPRQRPRIIHSDSGGRLPAKVVNIVRKLTDHRVTNPHEPQVNHDV